MAGAELAAVTCTCAHTGGTKPGSPVWVIRIGEPTPSQNQFKRMHPRAYKKLRDKFQTYLMVEMVNQRIPKAAGKRRLIITRYAKHVRYKLDRGNVVGGCKPVLDAAVRLGLLIDDREDHLDDHYIQDVDPKAPRTEIRIEDLADDAPKPARQRSAP